MNTVYIMKLALFYKGAFIDSNFIKLQDDEHLLDRAELYRIGKKIGDCEIKAVPVTAKSQDKLMAIDTDTTKGQWYINHALSSFEGFSDLLRKGGRFLLEKQAN